MIKVTDEQVNIDNYTRIWRSLGSIYKMMYKGMDKKFVEMGTSVLEYRILRILVETGRKTMANLADLNFVTQAWITGMADRMEEKGYVKRARSSEDRRVIYVELTEKGQIFIEKMRKVHDEFLKDLFSFIQPEESELLANAIEKFSRELEKKISISE